MVTLSDADRELLATVERRVVISAATRNGFDATERLTISFREVMYHLGASEHRAWDLLHQLGIADAPINHRLRVMFAVASGSCQVRRSGRRLEAIA